MNRREMFKGGAAAAIGPSAWVGLTGGGEKAYTIGNPQCGKCLSIMPVEARPVPHMFCVNPRCERYEIKYLVPMTELERM